MVTTDVVSRAMQTFALQDPISTSNSADFPVGAVAAASPVPVADSQPSPPLLTDDDEMPDIFTPEDHDDDFNDNAVEADEATGQPAQTRRSARIAEGVKPPDRLNLTTQTQILATKVREDKNEGTVNAVKA
jgi:hypothetical protein